MTKSDDRERFFFAETAAGMYDRTIDLVVPRYRLMQDTVARLLSDHLVEFSGGHPSTATGTILDVGSGTGSNVETFLTAFPSIHMVALDLCEPMCRQLDTKLATIDLSGIPLTQRCRVVQGDVLADAGDPKRLLSLISANESSRGFAVVLTSLTVHHFEHDEKHLFYRRAFEVLEPGGLLLNADLYSYSSPELTKSALAFDLNWINEQFNSPSREFIDAQSLPVRERERLRDLWINHYLSHNRLEALEGDALAAAPVRSQYRMLHDIGFRQIAVVYRYSLSGILWARK